MKTTPTIRLIGIALIILIVAIPAVNHGTIVAGSPGSARATENRMITPMTAGDFSVASNPDDIAVARGSYGTFSVVVNSLNGFSGTVSFTAASKPSGLTLSFTPTSGSLSAGCSCSSVLTVSTSTTTPTGLYNVNVTATSGSVSHTITVQVAVTPISWTINDNENFTRVNVRTTGSFSMDSPSNVLTVSGTATVTAKNATTGVQLFTQTYMISKESLNYPYQGGYLAKFILNVAVNPYPLGFHLELELSGPTSTAPGTTSTYLFVYRNADVNGLGFVTMADVTTAAAAFNCSVGQQCYNPRADLNADGTVTIGDVSVIAFFFLATNYGVASYSVSSSTNSLTVQVGSSATATITLNSVFSFAGTIGLVATVSPAGPSASLNPTSVTLSSGGSGQSTLTVSASSSTPPGFYTVNVNATSGTKTHTVSLTVAVVDFTISASPADFAITGGHTSTSTISLAPLNGFTGTVSLTATVTPSGPKVSISPSSVTLSGCGATSTLSIKGTGTPGLYNIVVNATSGSVSHTVTVQVAISPLTWTINDNERFTGVNVNTTGTLTLDNPSNTITVSGTVRVVATNASTGASLFSKTYTISQLPLSYPYNGGYQGLFLVNVAVNPYALATYIILNLSAPTSTTPGAPSVPTPFVARNADVDANGTVDQADLNTISASFDCSIGQQCYNPRADLNADGTVTIVDVSIAARYFGSTNYI